MGGARGPYEGFRGRTPCQVQSNLGHKMEWTVLVKGLKNTKIRKIFEAFYIAKFRPSLNGQVKHQNLTLFRNGIT